MTDHTSCFFVYHRCDQCGAGVDEYMIKKHPESKLCSICSLENIVKKNHQELMIKIEELGSDIDTLDKSVRIATLF